MENKEEPLFLSLGFEEYTKQLFGALVSAASAANDLSEDYTFIRAAYPSFSDSVNQISQRILNLEQRLIHYVDPDAETCSDLDPSVDDLELKFKDTILDAIDYHLDKVDLFIYESKHHEAKNALATKTQLFREKGQSSRQFMHVHNILRPQDGWSDRIDNCRSSPFIPRITSKPHATVPLDPIFIRSIQPENEGQSLRKAFSRHSPQDKDMLVSFPHPYKHELLHLTYPPAQMKRHNEIAFLPYDETPLTWVDTLEALADLISILKLQKEIAVDLEHHSFRSFQGLTCLMQISTRTEDFIVDTLALMTSLEAMNVIFADPKILKVFHGSDSDIKWLQRDFGIYVVNLFDTGQACRVLGKSSAKLMTLLDHYCSVKANKTLALEDWRIRPLPEQMLRYAREDTHYLLYIYDKLRNEHSAFFTTQDDRSRDLCLATYQKEEFTSTSYLKLLAKFDNEKLNHDQLAVLIQLYAWRDETARNADEGVLYVLPNKMLLNIAKTIPLNTTELLACCTPVPPYLRLYATEVCALIQKAPSIQPDSPIETIPEPQPETTVIMQTLQTPQCPLPSKPTRLSRSMPSVRLAKKNHGLVTNVPLKHSLFSDPKTNGSRLTAGQLKALRICKEINTLQLSPPTVFVDSDSAAQLTTSEKPENTKKRKPEKPPKETTALRDERHKKKRKTAEQ